MKKIVIIGGGYGGIKALQTLAKAKSDIDITLVDQHTYHYLQTESYDLVASKTSIDETFIYLPTLIKGIHPDFHFINDQAIDIKEKKLICKQHSLEFDYLIIATGSVTKFLGGFEAKGETSLGVKSLRAALKVKHYFENELFLRLEPAIAKECFHILVIGGGLSGVEIAAEMKNYFNNYSKNNALSCGNIKISLVSKHILKNQEDSVREKSIKRLKQLRVNLIPNYVKKIEEKSALLDNGERIDFDFAIFAGGIEPSPFIKNLAFKKDEKGFLVVDEFLRVAEDIYAIGDCAKLVDKKGKVIPPTAQSAEQSGCIAAKNILNSIENKPLIKADIKLLGLAIALGGRYAIAVTPFGYSFNGIFGWMAKKGIEKYYKIPLKIKSKRGYNLIKSCKEQR